MSGNKIGIVRFWHKHPVLMNFLAIVVLAVLMVWLVGVVFLNYWTRHGEEMEMPQVKNLNVTDASRILSDAEFDVRLDSIFSSDVAPGTVVRQIPPENSMVKKGGTAYLTYVCYTTKKAKVPDFVDGSAAAALSNFKSRGFENIEVAEVPAEQNDLVLGATYNGLELKPGMEIPINARIVIKVGVSSRTAVDYGDVNPEDSDAEFIEDLFDDGSGYDN